MEEGKEREMSNGRDQKEALLSTVEVVGEESPQELSVGGSRGVLDIRMETVEGRKASEVLESVGLRSKFQTREGDSITGWDMVNILEDPVMDDLFK